MDSVETGFRALAPESVAVQRGSERRQQHLLDPAIGENCREPDAIVVGAELGSDAVHFMNQLRESIQCRPIRR